MAVFLYVKTILESPGVITVTSEATGKVKERLFDRDKGAQWEATSNAQQDIDVDRAVAGTVSVEYLTLVNYSITTNIEIYRGGTSPPTTLVSTVTASGDPYRIKVLGGPFTDRYWRLRILTGGVTPKIGEVLLGTRYTLPTPSGIQSPAEGVVGNVRRDESVGGSVKKVRLGDARKRFGWAWENVQDADWTELTGAFAAAQESAKNVLIEDWDANLYWVELVEAQIESRRPLSLRRSFVATCLEAL